MFVGNTLTNIRILHGYNRKQLAEEIGVTEQAVWQYENGFATPKLEVINQLKVLFNVKGKFFYQEDLLSKQNQEFVNHNHIAYRASERNSVQKTQMERIHIEYTIAFLQKIADKFRLPENKIRKLRDEVLKIMSEDMSEDQRIAEAAIYARTFLEMDQDSNDDFLFRLEKNGVFVFEKPFGEKIDAYSLWSKDDTPYIMLGSTKGVAVRRNYDLAHELGHLLMHYKEEFSLQEKSAHNEYEKQANTFAGYFLLPEKEIRKDLESLDRISNPDSYVDLKQKWNVSIQALGFRARVLGIMTGQQFKYFYAQINKKGYRQLEPLDREILLQRPGKVRSILQFLFENQYIKLDNLLQSLQAEEGFLTTLTGIEPDFFIRYKKKKNRMYSTEDLADISVISDN